MSFWSRISPAIAALFISSIACVTLMDEQSATSPSTQALLTGIPVTGTPAATETPAVVAPATCPVITDKVMEMSLLESGSEEGILDEEIYLVMYIVSGNEISDPYYEDVGTDLQDEQNDLTTHQQVWDYFTALIPAGQRSVIGEYSITTDGEGGALASVTQTYDDPNIWALEVDIADSRNYHSLTFTLIHEFGHLLTLGPSQVPPSLAVFNNPDDNDIYLQEVSACPQYFPSEGCANPDSYINAYFKKFWTKIHEEWNDINLEEDEDVYYSRLDEFYYNYADQFVTDYAATNPEEDIAEVWSFFVLGPKPAGSTIAEEKILFFYQYPELVQLREEILDNLCNSFPDAKP